MKKLLITFEQGTGEELYREMIEVPDREPTDFEKLEARVAVIEAKTASLPERPLI